MSNIYEAKFLDCKHDWCGKVAICESCAEKNIELTKRVWEAKEIAEHELELRKRQNPIGAFFEIRIKDNGIFDTIESLIKQIRKLEHEHYYIGELADLRDQIFDLQDRIEVLGK